MRRRAASAVLAALGAGSIVVVGLVTSASAGTSPTVQIDAVIVGTPTGPLEVQLDCPDSSFLETYPVTESGPVTTAVPYSNSGQTCTVTATETAGATVTYACETENDAVLTCTSDNQLTDTTGGVVTGTVTVTFTFAPPPPPEPAPIVVIGPTFTG